MGILVEGTWMSDAEYASKKDGKFRRLESSFRCAIGDKKFPAASGRYHLYVSYACPWAHRAMIMRNLKGLQNIISMTSVEPYMGEDGWVLGEGADPHEDQSFLRDLYVMAEPSYSGRATVPVLWDIQKKCIVNNESSEIIRMLNEAFDDVGADPEDYYPPSLRKEIDALNDYIYPNINNGVYKAGFASKQDAYEEAVDILFASLDHLEDRMKGRMYLVADQLTEADIRLFTTLIRFDSVYVSHFKCSIRRIKDYPNLSSYLKRLYQHDAIKPTVRMDHIKTHYYTSHRFINPTGIIPKGPDISYD